jgi:hypothetical protein
MKKERKKDSRLCFTQWLVVTKFSRYKASNKLTIRSWKLARIVRKTTTSRNFFKGMFGDLLMTTMILTLKEKLKGLKGSRGTVFAIKLTKLASFMVALFTFGLEIN